MSSWNLLKILLKIYVKHCYQKYHVILYKSIVIVYFTGGQLSHLLIVMYESLMWLYLYISRSLFLSLICMLYVSHCCCDFCLFAISHSCLKETLPLSCSTCEYLGNFGCSWSNGNADWFKLISGTTTLIIDVFLFTWYFQTVQFNCICNYWIITQPCRLVVM